MTQPSTEDLRRDYVALMRDVVVRSDAIDAIIDCPGALPPRLVREFCYLQIRMMCELVALGCVVVHDQLPAAEVKKLRKQYHPDKIIAKISEYEPQFFPNAVKRVDQMSDGSKQIALYEPPLMTPKDLTRMWGKTGDVLHLGGVNRAREQTAVDPRHTEVKLMQRRLLDLLNDHVILTVQKTRPIIVQLRNAELKDVRLLTAVLISPSGKLPEAP